MVSLGVLVANDHFLKGSGLLPGWLTGKLSDLAGLVVLGSLHHGLVLALLAWGQLHVGLDYIHQQVALPVGQRRACRCGQEAAPLQLQLAEVAALHPRRQRGGQRVVRRQEVLGAQVPHADPPVLEAQHRLPEEPLLIDIAAHAALVGREPEHHRHDRRVVPQPQRQEVTRHALGKGQHVPPLIPILFLLDLGVNQDEARLPRQRLHLRQQIQPPRRALRAVCRQLLVQELHPREGQLARGFREEELYQLLEERREQLLEELIVRDPPRVERQGRRSHAATCVGTGAPLSSGRRTARALARRQLRPSRAPTPPWPMRASSSSGSLGAAAVRISAAPAVTSTSSSMRTPMPR